MSTATVTSKGQITIPVEVRTRLGLQAGSRVAFVATADGGFEIHPATGSISELKGTVTPPPQSVSIEQMDEAIAHGRALP